jgi:hypothetical protein
MDNWREARREVYSTVSHISEAVPCQRFIPLCADCYETQFVSAQRISVLHAYEQNSAKLHLSTMKLRVGLKL